MRRVALILLIAACGDDEPLPTGPITARVTAYDYAFDIDSRAAHAKLTLDVETGGDCIKFPFRATSPANVKLDGEDANAALSGEVLDICGIGVRSGTETDLELDLVIPLATLADSQVGYSIKNDNQQNPFYYLVSWVNGCDRFGPCDNRPDQFASFKFTVTHPANFKARCPGTITEVSATQTECNFTHAGGPTYSTFGVAAYPAWTIIDKGTWGGVKVSLYDRSTTMIEAAIDVAYHSGFMTWMQSQFGPYPYGDELRILTAPTYWGGFEHPGNIVLRDSLARTTSNYWNGTAHTLDHEIVHQWAGDQTTLASTYDFVWKEAMAEYLTYVYEDMTNPVYGLRTAGAWKLFSQDAAFYPVPTNMPALFDYYGDVYGPGPMVLFRQLEVLTSRDQVLAAIKTLLGTPRALSVDEVVAALEQSTGLDLDNYAAAWIRGSERPNWPRYAVTFTPGTGTSMLALDQVNEKPNARGCKFRVALRGATAGQEQLVEVNTFTGGADQTLTVPTPAFTVTSIALDPFNECLVYLMSSSPIVVPRHPWLPELSGPNAPR